MQGNEDAAGTGDTTRIGVFSLHGSPGATTVALGLAVRLHHAGTNTLLLEADPDGGVVAARFDLSLSPNLTDLAAAARRPLATEEVLRYAQPLGAGLPAVLSHPSAEQTRVALTLGAAPIANALAALGGTTVVDLGRWRADSPARPLFDAADVLLLVMRPTLEQTVQVLHLVDTITQADRLLLVVVGSRPYSARQVADTTGVPVIASLPAVRDRDAVNPFVLGVRRRDRWPIALGQIVEALTQPGSRPTRTTSRRVDAGMTP